jgi:hypothetical protein
MCAARCLLYVCIPTRLVGHCFWRGIYRSCFWKLLLFSCMVLHVCHRTCSRTIFLDCIIVFEVVLWSSTCLCSSTYLSIHSSARLRRRTYLTSVNRSCVRIGSTSDSKSAVLSSDHYSDVTIFPLVSFRLPICEVKVFQRFL